MRVPWPSAAGFTACFLPPSTTISTAFCEPVSRVEIESFATAPIEGSASPRKPKVETECRSSFAKLGGGMALDGERQIVARHAAAVVGDADEPPAAAREHDLDSASARVEGVLDQLLHDGSRPLDDLAGGDAVDDRLGQLTDGHGATLNDSRCGI